VFACEGLEKPLIFRTYCSAASCTSSSVAGGSKLKSVWMFRHIGGLLSRGLWVSCDRWPSRKASAESFGSGRQRAGDEWPSEQERTEFVRLAAGAEAGCGREQSECRDDSAKGGAEPADSARV